MNNDNMMSAASVEYIRGYCDGEKQGLQAAIGLLSLIEQQPDGTYKVGITGYSDPISAMEDIIQKVLDKAV